MKKIIPLILLLSIFASLAVSSMLRKSGTADEICHHIPSGYILLTKGDFKMATDSPPLARYIIAAPLKLFMRLNLPDDRSIWRVEDRAEFARDFFFKYNNQSKQMLLFSRLMIVLIGLLCGLLIFIWSNKLYGLKTALFALFLYILSPNILAHTRLATADMAVSFFILLSIYAFWRFYKNPNRPNLIIAGICLGLAQLTKYSALILYPIFLILFVFLRRKLSLKATLLIFLISILMLWAGYGFNTEPLLEDAMRQEEKIELIDSKLETLLPVWNDSIKERVNHFLLKVPVPLGEHILGVLGVIRHSQIGHGTYFWGTHSGKGNILYFIVAFLIKTPIPLIALLIMGIFVLIKKRLTADEYFLILPPAAFFFTALFSNIQIGLRHILPVYPFVFIIAARSLCLLRHRIIKVIIPVLCIWYIIAFLSIQPDYLSYFNEFAGGPDNGWKILRDSNFGWGQDLPALSDYMKREEIDEVVLNYSLCEDRPSVYGIKSRPIKQNELKRPGNRVYAISPDSVTWSKEHEPTAKAGKSIFIYDFRDKR